MKKKNYDEVSVIRSLAKNREIDVDSINRVVAIVMNNTTVGNGTWGKIDFLCHHCGYIYRFVNNVGDRRLIRSFRDEDVDINVVNAKVMKREAKINLANNARNIMRNTKIKR